MKLLVLLLAAAAAGGYIVYAHSNVVPQAEQAAQAAIQAVVNPSPSAAPATPPAAPVPPVILTFPSPTPADDATPAPTQTPAPRTAGDVWSTADCGWAEAVMAWDHRLDAGMVVDITNGTNTAYGNSPQIIAYYQQYATDWQTIGDSLHAVCDQGGSITATQVQYADATFAKAIYAHGQDSNPQDAEWSAQWIGYYTRLTAMMHATGLA